jgi:hypothetical protein
MHRSLLRLSALLLVALPGVLAGQGVTTGTVVGFVTDSAGNPVGSANVVAVHLPSGTQYRALARASGAYTLPNLRVGGPYRVTGSFVGFQPLTRENVFVTLGETQRVDLVMGRVAAQLTTVQVLARGEEATQTGAGTFVDPQQVAALPSIKRSTRDLTRLDPRSDGNFSFAGRNWLFNSISLDGSYFSNSFGLDDPAPGGQTNAEPVPFDAVEQVQVSIAPFDVRQGGFTGASINTVTKSGTNEFKGSAYTFFRNDAMIGNEVGGQQVVANPSLRYNQSGASVSGPLMRDRLFFFINAEVERTQDPGSNFIANRGAGAPGFGVSRVTTTQMDAIRARLLTYGYDTGPYEGYINETNNDKLLAKLDWNVSPAHTASLRYNYLDASRDLPPHPFVLSFANTGRGPNVSSLPFRNSGYEINNQLHSVAAELNSRSNRLANRFFVSYNRFRDHRAPFSAPFPTIEIGEGGVTYTTAGHEPFSIHNILDQDVWQLTNNLSFFRGNHTYTIGANLERFAFFNSFNIFRHGVFFLPAFIPVGSTFGSLAEFFAATDPNDPNRKDFNAMIGSGPFKGEEIDVGQFSLYLQDEMFATNRLALTYGVRVDFPTYFTDPVDNPFSRGLAAADEDGQSETVDQSKLPGAAPMFSPRVGFNWDVRGDQSMRVRGGTGVFTGRVPFVWIGNVISNPGGNPNLRPAAGAPARPTRKESELQQSFDVNAMVDDFKWPQTWTTNLAVETGLPWATRGVLEVLYAKDLHNVFMRNADLGAPLRTLPDGRPYYGGFGFNERNPDGGAGIYVIDNTDKGYSFNVTAQVRRSFLGEGSAGLGYSYTQAKNALKSTEIASVLWQNQPIQGNPNRPELSYSEFGQRNRVVGDATYVKRWSTRSRTSIGAFLELAEGNRFAGAGGNRYSFIYSGDVNGDGAGGNDLIYIPRTQSEIRFAQLGSVTPAEQWARFDAFINQDKYLSGHRGQIAERFGLLNPWYSNLDLRVTQDIGLARRGRTHGFQLIFDVMNVANLINSDWGVRQIADPTATSPLTLVRFDPDGVPVFNFTGPNRTFIDDPDLLSRWRAQIGLKYFLD